MIFFSWMLAIQQAGKEFSSSFKGRVEGPGGLPDFLIVGLSVLIVIVVLVLSIKYFVKPGEKSESHIKRVILKDDIGSDGGEKR